MKYFKNKIDGLIVCKPILHKDNRGFIYESFKKESFNNFIGHEVEFCQDNISFSKYGVIRGLHTNTLSFAQNKLISVLDGEILDVAVDFRKGSPTFGEHFSINLSSHNKKQLFVPIGFLHGFSVLSKESTVLIKVDKYFAKGESIGVKYNDSKLNINWKINDNNIILSDADKNLNNFNENLSPFEYNIIS